MRVTEAMTKLGLSCPLDDQAIGELAQELRVAKSDAPPHLVRTKKILTSRNWRHAVDRVRRNRIPKEGFPCQEARALHDALLDSLAGHPKDIEIGLTKKSVVEYWGDVIRETRRLCPMLFNWLKRIEASQSHCWTSTDGPCILNRTLNKRGSYAHI